TQATRSPGSSSLQRGCLQAVATPREIPWLCVPPSPAVCPLERSYGLRRGKNHAFCEGVPDVKVWNVELHGIMHYLPQNTVQKEAAGKPPPLTSLHPARQLTYRPARLPASQSCSDRRARSRTPSRSPSGSGGWHSRSTRSSHRRPSPGRLPCYPERKSTPPNPSH